MLSLIGTFIYSPDSTCIVELGHIITSLIVVLNCENWQKVFFQNRTEYYWLCISCKLSGAAAEPPVPADSGWTGVSLLSGPGHRDSWNVPHSHQAGPKTFPQACECCCPHWTFFKMDTYCFFRHYKRRCILSCTVTINVRATLFTCIGKLEKVSKQCLCLYTGAWTTSSCHVKLQSSAALWAQVSGPEGGESREIWIWAQEAFRPADWHLPAAGLCSLC